MSIYPADLIFKHCAYETSQNGYVKRSDDGSPCTADNVVKNIEGNLVSDVELQSVADRVLGWSAYINSREQSGQYFDDVRKEVDKKVIDESKVGLIASSFSSYDKHLYYMNIRDKEKQSQYLGKVDDVIAFEMQSFKLIKTGESKRKDIKYKWYMYKLYDTKGNIAIYFSNKNEDYELASHKHIECTVKQLTELNGVKQTQVTKLKFK